MPRISTDAGPLVALIDRRHPHTASCPEVLADIADPLSAGWSVCTSYAKDAVESA